MNVFEWIAAIYIGIGIIFDLVAIITALMMKNKGVFYLPEFLAGILFITLLWPWALYDILTSDDGYHD